jgi:hypothetical protein
MLKGFYIHNCVLRDNWAEVISNIDNKQLSKQNDPFLIRALAHNLLEKLLQRELPITSSICENTPIVDDDEAKCYSICSYVLNSIRKKLVEG